MSTTVITFFNNKGGVGKTSLVYHLAWMYADRGKRVVAVDLDPQANLTAAFISEDDLEILWESPDEARTVYDCVQPLLKGTGDLANPSLRTVTDNLLLLPGDLTLSNFEDELSQQWTQCLDGKERAFRVISAFWRVMQNAASMAEADLVLADVGPNLGAINRAALVATDYVIVPLSPDMFSLRGLDNLGPVLRDWRKAWNDRLSKNPSSELALPQGNMKPAGYVVLQHSVRLDRPTAAYDRWMARIPGVYHKAVLDEPDGHYEIQTDHECLAALKHYRSLMPMAHEARKPVFHLRAADGAIGAHARAVTDAYRDFQILAKKIAERTEIEYYD